MIKNYLGAIEETVQNTLGVTDHTLDKLIWTGVLIVLYLLIRFIVARMIDRWLTHVSRHYVFSKISSGLLAFVTLLLIVRIWIGGIANLVTYLAILSAGVAVALQGPLVNMAGWFYLLFRKPFNVGDRIEIAGMMGDVIDIRLFQFTMIEVGNWVDADQSTGRLINFPNGRVFQEPVANFSQGFEFIWNELPVTVTFESDWKAAKDILQRIANENNPFDTELARSQIRSASQRYMIFYNQLTPIVWTKVIDFGVTLTIRYLCEPRARRATSSRIWEAVLTAFSERDDIDLAYPTRRVYHNYFEGKTETGGPLSDTPGPEKRGPKR